mgnify:CR=1 FL=1
MQYLIELSCCYLVANAVVITIWQRVSEVCLCPASTEDDPLRIERKPCEYASLLVVADSCRIRRAIAIRYFENGPAAGTRVFYFDRRTAIAGTAANHSHSSNRTRFNVDRRSKRCACSGAVLYFQHKTGRIFVAREHIGRPHRISALKRNHRFSIVGPRRNDSEPRQRCPVPQRLDGRACSRTLLATARGRLVNNLCGEIRAFKVVWQFKFSRDLFTSACIPILSDSKNRAFKDVVIQVRHS